MNLQISDTNCWMCGSTSVGSIHHGIPKQFKPKHNVLIPLCNDCHQKINSVDLGSVSSYLYRILNELKQKKIAIMGMKKIVEGMKNDTKQ